MHCKLNTYQVSGQRMPEHARIRGLTALTDAARSLLTFETSHIHTIPIIIISLWLLFFGERFLTCHWLPITWKVADNTKGMRRPRIQTVAAGSKYLCCSWWWWHRQVRHHCLCCSSCCWRWLLRDFACPRCQVPALSQAVIWLSP